MPIFTRETLAAFAPRPSAVAKGKAWDDYVAALIEHGDALCAEHGIDEPLELHHFMAQIAHESGGFSLMWESMHYSADRISQIFGVGRHSAAVKPAEAQRLAGNPQALADRVYGIGNPRKARELGNREPGDGWRYRGFGVMQTTGRDAHERLLNGETTPIAAVRAAFVEWSERGCNTPARADDIKTVTRRINGGQNGIADRRAWLDRAKRVWPTLPRPVLADDSVVAQLPPIAGSDRPPPQTMAQSTTGNTAVALGAGGTVSTASEVSMAMAKVAGTGSFSIPSFMMALAQSPTFWIGVFTIAGAAYVWLERRRKLVKHGI